MTKTTKATKLSTLAMGLMIGISSFTAFSFTEIGNNESETSVNELPAAPVPQPLLLDEEKDPLIPENLDFAGEKVPVEREEVKKKLDRELDYNYNDKSSTKFILGMVNRWFPVIEPILSAYGVPNDFKYLCIAESALQNKVSPVGAAGFWQFMPGTAPEYGLEIGREVDERYNVQKATEAAAKYLKQAYQRLGSWTAAAAAYNMGQGGLNKQRTIQGTDDYFSLRLPEETMRYVHRILAFKLLVGHAERYGLNISPDDVYQPVATRMVKVTSTIRNLADFAVQHGTSLKKLKELNPWLRDKKLTVKNGKSYLIALPTTA